MAPPDRRSGWALEAADFADKPPLPGRNGLDPWGLGFRALGFRGMFASACVHDCAIVHA